MKGSLRLYLPAICILIAGVGCSKPQPIVPRSPVPAGTVLIQFTRRVEGPLELTIDGSRIPVQKISRKKCMHLEVSGLIEGRHHFVLMSALEAFGPDQFDVDLAPAKGEFKVLISQELKSVLYGTPEPSPAATGIPGVQARLER